MNVSNRCLLECCAPRPGNICAAKRTWVKKMGNQTEKNVVHKIKSRLWRWLPIRYHIHDRPLDAVIPQDLVLTWNRGIAGYKGLFEKKPTILLATSWLRLSKIYSFPKGKHKLLTWKVLDLPRSIRMKSQYGEGLRSDEWPDVPETLRAASVWKSGLFVFSVYLWTVIATAI